MGKLGKYVGKKTFMKDLTHSLYTKKAGKSNEIVLEKYSTYHVYKTRKKLRTWRLSSTLWQATGHIYKVHCGKCGIFVSTYINQCLKILLTMESGTFNCSVSKRISPARVSFKSLATTFMVDALQGGRV